MATLTQIIYNIKNLKAGGVQSQSIKLSDRQYAFIINYYRAILLKREVEKGRTVSTGWTQNLGKVDIGTVDKNECCTIENCSLRTKLQLPSPVQANGEDLLTYVGTTDSLYPFQRSTPSRLVWDSDAIYTGKLPKYYRQNGYIYLANAPGKIFDYLNVQGVFEDPTAAEIFRTCSCPANSVDCFKGFDYDYPIPVQLLDGLYKMMMDAELKFMKGILPDTLDDAKDVN